MNASAIKRITFLFVIALLSFQFPISIAAPGDPYGYEDARNLYQTNKRLQDLIDARNERIRRNQEALNRLRRESRANGVDAVLNNADIQALERAIESDRRDIRLYQHRQSIVARNWDKSNLRTYYGSLQDTSRRSIYDPKTKRERNLMDYRLDAFRNPVPRHSRPEATGERHVNRSTRDTRYSDTRSRSYSPQNSHRISQPTSNSRNTSRNTSRNQSGNSNRTTRSTHTITLTPTK